jgi:hypothetical protein
MAKRPGMFLLLCLMAAALDGCLRVQAQPDGKHGPDQGLATPKRVAPPAVAPLVINGVRIEVVNQSRKRGMPQNGGYLEAFDIVSGRSLWLLQVYKIDYDAKMEEDVQDRFIEKLELKPDGKTLLVTDESANRFDVDLDTRMVSPVHARPGQ